jgi:Protein of unknown function (DUF3072)
MAALSQRGELVSLARGGAIEPLRRACAPSWLRFSFGQAEERSISLTEEIMSSKSDKKKPAAKNLSNTIKDPDEWTTGEEPMTGAQESYLHTLATEAGEQVEPDLTKAEASKRIDELREKTGRGETTP